MQPQHTDMQMQTGVRRHTLCYSAFWQISAQAAVSAACHRRTRVRSLGVCMRCCCCMCQVCMHCCHCMCQGSPTFLLLALGSSTPLPSSTFAVLSYVHANVHVFHFRSPPYKRLANEHDISLSDYMVCLDNPIGLTLAPDPQTGKVSSVLCLDHGTATTAHLSRNVQHIASKPQMQAVGAVACTMCGCGVQFATVCNPSTSARAAGGLLTITSSTLACRSWYSMSTKVHQQQNAS